MSSDYFKSVITFLKDNLPEKSIPVVQQVLPSPFEMLYFAEKKIIIHLVQLNENKLKSFKPGFFKELSDEADNKHLKIIHLWEDQWYKRKETTQLRLLAQLGISTKIHGRLTKVVKLDKNTSIDFINQHHLQLSTTAARHYGLVFKNELMAVAAIGKKRKMTYEKAPYYSYELIRFVTKAGYTISGGLSKLIKHFIKENNILHLMTYADRDWGNGSSYSKIGFKNIINTAPQQFWINPKEMIRYYEHRLPEKINRLLSTQKQTDIESAMKDLGYLKIFNSGNTKFIYDLRNNETV